MIYRDIFKKALRTTLFALIFLILISLIWLLNYPNFQETLPKTISFLEEIDINKLKALNIDLSIIHTPLGYYAVLINVLVLVYVIYASILALNTIASDIELDRATPTKPLQPKQYLKSKILIALGPLFLLNLIMFIFNSIYLSCLTDNVIANLFLIQCGLLISQLTIYFIMLMFSTFIRNKSLFSLVSFFILALLFSLMVIYKMTDFKLLAYINSLCFFNYIEIITTKTFQIDYLAAWIIISFFAISFTFSLYDYKED